MKITRRQLKRIIREEVSLLSESYLRDQILPGGRVWGPRDMESWQKLFAMIAIHVIESYRAVNPDWRDTGPSGRIQSKVVKLVWDTISSKLDERQQQQAERWVGGFMGGSYHEDDYYERLDKVLKEKVGVAALQELGRKIDDLVEEERDAQS